MTDSMVEVKFPLRPARQNGPAVVGGAVSDEPFVGCSDERVIGPCRSFFTSNIARNGCSGGRRRLHRLNHDPCAAAASLCRGERVGCIRGRCDDPFDQGFAFATCRNRSRAHRCSHERCCGTGLGRTDVCLRARRGAWRDRGHEISILFIDALAAAESKGDAAQHDQTCAASNGQGPVGRGIVRIGRGCRFSRAGRRRRLGGRGRH